MCGHYGSFALRFEFFTHVETDRHINTVYAKEYDIVFNCKKTVGIQFGNRRNNCVIKLNGNEIKWQRSVKHLGNIMEDCRFKKSILIGNVNKFIGNYSTLKNCSKRKLFQSYCTSF